MSKDIGLYNPQKQGDINLPKVLLIAMIVLIGFFVAKSINQIEMPSWLTSSPTKIELIEKVSKLETVKDLAVATNANLVQEATLIKDIAEIEKKAIVSNTEKTKAVKAQHTNAKKAVKDKAKAIEQRVDLTAEEKTQAIEDEYLSALTQAYLRLPSSQRQRTSI